MELQIKENKENELLKRNEVTGTLIFEGTTSNNKEVAVALAKKYNAEVGLVVVKHIYTKFSHQEANFEAVIYKDLKTREFTERKTATDRKKAADAKKAEKKEAE